MQGFVSGEGPGRKLSAHVRVMTQDREEAARVSKPRPPQRFSLRDLMEVKEMVDNGAWNLEGQTNDSRKGIDLDEGQDEQTSAKESSLDKNLLERPRMDDDWWSKVKKSHAAQRAVVETFQVRPRLITSEGMPEKAGPAFRGSAEIGSVYTAVIWQTTEKLKSEPTGGKAIVLFAFCRSETGDLS